MELLIVANPNSENLGFSRTVEKITELCRKFDIPLQFDHNFKIWSGGEGYRSGGAYVKLEGWGRIDDIDEGLKALSYCLSDESSVDKTDYPSYEKFEDAFDIIDEFNI